ncbi:MAG: Protein required for Brome mosaic virus replication [Trizodia sp. TS-e1964]|nr:MAG: Protein required for Brome mosaic virus replication [Trizodia sp. TS-e1964]
MDAKYFKGNLTGTDADTIMEYSINEAIEPGASAQVLSSAITGIRAPAGKENNLTTSNSRDLGQGTQKQDASSTQKRAIIIRKTYKRKGSNENSTSPTITSLAEVETMKIAKIHDALNAYHSGSRDAADILAAEARSNIGIPGELRKHVWPVLLETHPLLPRRSTEAKAETPSLAEEVEVPIKRIRAELARYHRRMKGIPIPRYAGSPISTSPGAESTASNSTVNTSSSTMGSLNPDFLDQLALDSAIEEAIVSYLESHRAIEYCPGMVYVCITLSDWLFILPSNRQVTTSQKALTDVLSVALSQTLTIMRWSPSSKDTTEAGVPRSLEKVIASRISYFLTTFGRLMPQLASHFEEEEFDGLGEEWVQTWIQWWCAREMRKQDKGRLWDFYLGYRPSSSSSPDIIDISNGDGEQEPPLQPATLTPGNTVPAESYTPADWHTFVCLAVLRACKEALEELEMSEIRTLMGRLPRLGMQAILKEAAKMRRELMALNSRQKEMARESPA